MSVCIQTIPHCASCLDHRTCERCQQGFVLHESYWGGLYVNSCPEDFTEIGTNENGLVCKSSKGMNLTSFFGRISMDQLKGMGS